MIEYSNCFTTNKDTTDGEVLGRIYELIQMQHLNLEEIQHFIRLSLEYAKEERA